jgi:hypothetical protein
MSANGIGRHAATKYAQRITACPRKSVESLIECGRLLIAAKDELKHGEFLKVSTAQALMKIASDGRITKVPTRWLFARTLVNTHQIDPTA